MPDDEIVDPDLAKSQAHRALVSLLEIERERRLHPHELVAKGRLMQLEDDSTFELSDAENSFKAALASDEDYAPALAELAWFYYAVEDDSPRALPLFERTIDLLREQLAEAISGKVKCLEEIESPEIATAYLQTVNRNLLLVEKLDEEHQAWLKGG